eukprot:764143-Hanusia_phi.AAC.6
MIGGKYIEQCWQALESGSMKKYARMLGVTNAVLMFGIPFLTLIIGRVLNPSNFAFLVIFGFFCGVLELPFCCNFATCCIKLQELFAPIESRMWLKACFYLVVATILITCQVHVAGGPAGWTFGILTAINAVLYALAVFYPDSKEESAGEIGGEGVSRNEVRSHDIEYGSSPPPPPPKEMSPVDPNAAGADLQSAVGSAVLNHVKENPKLIQEALKAAGRI